MTIKRYINDETVSRLAKIVNTCIKSYITSVTGLSISTEKSTYQNDYPTSLYYNLDNTPLSICGICAEPKTNDPVINKIVDNMDDVSYSSIEDFFDDFAITTEDLMEDIHNEDLFGFGNGLAVLRFDKNSNKQCSIDEFKQIIHAMNYIEYGTKYEYDGYSKDIFIFKCIENNVIRGVYNISDLL